MRLYTIAGWHYLGCVVNNRLYLVTKLGRVGDLIHP